MTSSTKPTCYAAGAMLLACGWAASASAQAEGDTTSAAQPVAAQGSVGNSAMAMDDSRDIVVTARKRNERLLDVPETVTAMSAEGLEKSGIRDLNDLGRNIPNVVLNRRPDNEANVVIRGVGSFGNVQGVGFYVDDVQNFFDQSARIVDLERVEVLKGPQGTLYGGNSIGGAIKFITRKPGPDAEGSVSVEAGDQRIVNVSGSANIPLSEKVFLRVSGYAATNNGFLKNPSQRQNLDKSTEGGVRAALRFLPSDQTDITITARLNFLENGNNYHLVNAYNDYNRLSLSNETMFNKRQVWGITAAINHDFGPVTLTSLTSYSDRLSEFRWDFDYSPLDLNLLTQPRPYHARHMTQELRLASNNDGNLNWLVGAYASVLKNGNAVLRGDVRIGVDAGEAFPGAPVPLILHDYFDRSTRETSYSGFGNVTYEIGALEVGVGARLHHVRYRATEHYGPASIVVSDTVVLPKVTLSYKPAPGIMIYASGAQGYEPGRATIGDLLRPGFLAPYKPEKSTNFEIGLKGEAFNRALQFEIAAFRIKYDNRQFETQVRDDAGTVQEVVANIGNATSWGIEASATLRPTSRLTLTASGGYLESTWDSAVYFEQSYDGNRTPYSPKFTGNAAAEYRLPVGSDHTLSLRADITHSSSFFWDVPNLAQQEAYDLVGLRVAFAPNDGPWEFAVRVQNLTDEGYNTELLNDYAGPGIHAASRGQPRLFLGTLNYKF